MGVKSKPIAVIKKRKRLTQVKKFRAEPKPAAEGTETEEQPDEEAVEEESDNEEGDEMDETEESEGTSAGDASAVSDRHIHPCACDLPAAVKKRIAEHNRLMIQKQLKFDRRVKEIEEQLARLEEERLEKEREMQEQEELFGDEYELVGKKKKRKKRSARRASMVSLGVKQVINWKKQPRYPVKLTRTYELRHKYTAYCGRIWYPELPFFKLDSSKKPHFKVRATISSSLRLKVNHGKKQDLIRREDKRPRFVTSYFT